MCDVEAWSAAATTARGKLQSGLMFWRGFFSGVFNLFSPIGLKIGLRTMKKYKNFFYKYTQ